MLIPLNSLFVSACYFAMSNDHVADYDEQSLFDASLDELAAWDGLGYAVKVGEALGALGELLAK